MKKYKVYSILILFLIFSSLSSRTISISQDKIMHFSGSAFITYWNYSFSKNIINLNERNSIFLSISFSSLEGLAKEFSDLKLKKTKFSKSDIFADMLGVCAGMIIINTVGD
ncbi:MAG: hypothetical protein U9N34_00155 [Candidatus Cloacimonadota bacterium]|nr:hypothetical protein [Candidatus Cloacimonadota bacterium]